MKITASTGNSIVSQLTGVLMAHLPRAINTGLMTHLGTVHADPKSKGKAVNFTWKRKTFRLTQNLKVQEYNFMNDPEATPDAIETENLIRVAVEA